MNPLSRFVGFVNPFFLVLCLIFVSLACFGVVNNYSPVPFWDMWNGYLEFYAIASQGDHSIWWSQHNEHRIILSRILFWLDIEFFSGTIWFLLIANFVFLSLITLTIVKFLFVKVNFKQLWMVFFLVSWMFFWSQNNNLTWGFQSQFYLAYLLPLASCFNLFRYKMESKTSNFILAVVFGFLSIGTMANGVLAMPLLLLLSFLLKLERSKKVVIFIITLLSLSIYFIDYHSIKGDGHTSLKDALLLYPLETIKYLFLYIGSPFFYIFNLTNSAKVIAMIMGMILSFTILIVSYHKYKKDKHDFFSWTLIICILYIGITAFITASGRVSQGIEQALSSRYTTPSLILWALLFVLLTPYILKLEKRYFNAVKLLSAVLLFAMLGFQVRALDSRDEVIFNEKLAALQVALHIKDDKQILYTFPSADWALAMISNDVTKGLSIFSTLPYKNAKEKIGTIINVNHAESQKCVGELESISDKRGLFYRFSGWAINKTTNKMISYGYMLSNEGVIVGAVILGFQRNDVGDIYGDKYLESGFVGYMQNDFSELELGYFYSPETHCFINVS